MLILGIANNDTAGACLIDGGNILAAVHEERFTRIKAHKIWPTRSINFVLSVADKKLEDTDIVAYGWKAGFNEDYSLNLYIERVIYECMHNFDNINILKKRVADEIINDQEKRAEFDFFISDNRLKSKVRYIDHHDTHAWGAWLCSPFEQSLVVTCDGRGDFISLTIRYIDKGKETVLQRETTIDSLGYFYGRITHLLGFKANRHEGKVTGLSAHGNPNKALPLMKKMIDVKNHRLVANCGEYYVPSYLGYSSTLINEISKYSPQDIAAAAQKHIENILTELLRPYVENYKINNLCLAGGLFGNVRLNQALKENLGIEKLFVLPCMGDEGLPLAAAITAQWRESGLRGCFNSMDLGPAFTDAEIESLLAEQDDLTVEKPANMQESVIDLLKNNHVMGFFRGRMEFGPRALCNRSIIYHANNKETNFWLNKRLERTEFMPFAPVIAENLAEISLVNWLPVDKTAEFMTITYNCKPVMLSMCPAVVHIDGTARPQIVKVERDPFMYQLLNKWYDLTGQPCLVNTSFNRHEEPIINTPHEALSVLRDGIISAVNFNDVFLVTRKSYAGRKN